MEFTNRDTLRPKRRCDGAQAIGLATERRQS
jgi:hypothetical protein